MDRSTKNKLRREATRNTIVDSAKIVFGKKGYRQTQVRDIISHAGVGIGTFYSHFKNKSDIFRNILFELSEELRTQVRDSFIKIVEQYEKEGLDLKETTPIAIGAPYKAFFQFARNNKHYFTILFREGTSHDEDFTDLMEEIYRNLAGEISKMIELGIEIGAIEKVDPEMVESISHAIVGMLAQVAQVYIGVDLPRFEKAIVHIVDFTKKGFGVKNNRKVS